MRVDSKGRAMTDEAPEHTKDLAHTQDIGHMQHLGSMQYTGHS